MPENWNCEVCNWLQISCENEFHFSESDYTAGCDNIDYRNRDGRGKGAAFSLQWWAPLHTRSNPGALRNKGV